MKRSTLIIGSMVATWIGLASVVAILLVYDWNALWAVAVAVINTARL